MACGKIVTEPTAGNGMLLLEVPASGLVQVNEIDPTRRQNFEAQGFDPTAVDAARPPMGTV